MTDSDPVVSPACSEPRTRHIALGLLVLAAPIIATNLSRTVMSFVDFVMVSQLGTSAQAAVVPASIVLWCLIAFGMGLVSVVNTVVSQSLGRGRHADCGAYGWQGVYISVAIGVAILPFWWLVGPLFDLAGHGSQIISLEVTYTQIGLLGLAPTIAALALSNFFIGVHRTTVGFVTALISNVFNIVANYALIFGHWGFPQLGMAGAAWGTVAATVLHALLLLAWFVMPYYGRTFHTWRTWRPHRNFVVDICRIGLPPGVQFTGDISAWAVFLLFFVGRFGETHLAATNICFKLLDVSLMPALGIGLALTAVVGKSIGQNRLDLARSYVRWGLLFNVSYMGLMGMVIVVLRHPLASLFSDDPQVIRWAGPMMIMCAIFQFGDALNITYGHCLRGAGDTLWPAVVWLLSSVVLLIGGSLIMINTLPQLASLGPWIAGTVHISVMSLVMCARYRWGPWQRMQLPRSD